MKVRLKTDRVGPAGYEPNGTVIEVDRATGRRMIEACQAEAVPRRRKTKTLELKEQTT